MPTTEGIWMQNTAPNDMQIFIDPHHLWVASGSATLTRSGTGLVNLAIGASQACVIEGLFTPTLRTGMYATPALDQQQFGTAASQPGPSTVANTSGPLALKPGFPPILAANMATLGAIQTGPIAKGVQINSLDVIYSVAGAALTSATVGVTKTVFANNAAPAVTVLLANVANGLPTAIQANPYVTNVALPTPAFITNNDAEPIIELDLTTASGGTSTLYGIVVRCSFNYN
jgi:hypothetical protein